MKNGRPESQLSFDARLNILIYAVNNPTFSTRDINEAVVSVSLNTIRNVIRELTELGYLERVSIYQHKATDLLLGLFNKEKNNERV